MADPQTPESAAVAAALAAVEVEHRVAGAAALFALHVTTRVSEGKTLAVALGEALALFSAPAPPPTRPAVSLEEQAAELSAWLRKHVPAWRPPDQKR